MIRGTVRAIVAIGLVAAATAVVRDPHRMLAPGPMTPGHETAAHDCFTCHVAGRGVPAERCTRCHARETIGLVTTQGDSIPGRSGTLAASFHARLIERDCTVCHSEHAGAAGGAAGRRFRHDMLDAATRHACESCHRAPADELHGAAAGACGTCHATERWKPATFAHEKYFVLDRNHSSACATCHPAGGFARYTCYGCHEHSESRIAGKHLEEGIRDFTDCVRCHRSGNEHEGREGEGHGERGGREGGRRHGGGHGEHGED